MKVACLMVGNGCSLGGSIMSEDLLWDTARMAVFWRWEQGADVMHIVFIFLLWSGCSKTLKCILPRVKSKFCRRKHTFELFSSQSIVILPFSRVLSLLALLNVLPPSVSPFPNIFFFILFFLLFLIDISFKNPVVQF